MDHAEEQCSRHDRLDELDEHRRLWIDTLSHARHDWLNDLQLILGYVQLRKYDKLVAYVDMLKQKMSEESRISRLGHPGLIEALLTYRTRPRPFTFSIHIEDVLPDLRSLSVSLDSVEFTIHRLLSSFELAAAEGARGSDNSLECAFGMDQVAVTMRFTYRGSYGINELSNGIEDVRKRWRSGSDAGCAVIEGEFEPSTAQVTLRIPISV